MNQTLAIIKPDAMEKGNMDNIKKDILDGGFSIVKEIIQNKNLKPLKILKLKEL